MGAIKFFVSLRGLKDVKVMGLTFKEEILQGIPEVLPELQSRDESVSHAPKRKKILTAEERRLALRNALRYFPKKHHTVLAKEFAKELDEYGRIYVQSPPDLRDVRSPSA